MNVTIGHRARVGSYIYTIRRASPIWRKMINTKSTEGGKIVATIRQPIHAKERADEIADLISAACEKLVKLSIEWNELNDEEGLLHARRMLNLNEVTLMLSTYLDASGLAHIALNLLRREFPMPRPYFEVRAPMLPWTLNSADVPTDPAAELRRQTDQS